MTESDELVLLMSHQNRLSADNLMGKAKVPVSEMSGQTCEYKLMKGTCPMGYVTMCCTKRDENAVYQVGE